TGYLFPAGVKAPSIGAIVARSKGRRHRDVPAYIYIGRDIDTSDEEKLFISEYIGPGFYGVRYAPFMIPDPAEGMATLSAVAGMQSDRLGLRQAYLRAVSWRTEAQHRAASAVRVCLQLMESARAVMHSPVMRGFKLEEER